MTSLPRALLVLGALALLSAGAPAESPTLVSDGRYAMGTVLEITLVARDDAEPVFDELYALAGELEAQMSRHDPASVVSQLNAAAGRGPQEVPQPVARIVAESLAWSRRTRGSFDVTIGPLVAIWERAARDDRVPPEAELRAARERTGPGRVRVDAESGTVELLAPGAAIDLGGVAKGFAIDRMTERLRARGVPGALLSFGQSSLAGLGTPPGEDGWRVLLRDAAGGFAGVVTLRDRALSVSGSLGQWSEIAGRRYGHVLDPRTGRPLTRRLAAAVAAPDATSAEALSKALLVLGAREGIDLLETLPDSEGFLIDETGARAATSGWAEAVRFAPWPEPDAPDAPDATGEPDAPDAPAP